MKIRRGDKVLVRLTADEAVAEDTRSKWFTALDRDGDEVTVCLDDVVAVEPKPLPKEPPMYTLAQVDSLKVFRRWTGGWGRIGGTAGHEEGLTWEQLNDLGGNALQIMVPLEETE